MRVSGTIFGIDGGGSSTRLLVADAAAVRAAEASGDPLPVLAKAKGASANVNSVGDEGLERNLRELFLLSTAAGYPPADFAAGCIGAAGAGRAGERERVERALRSIVGPDPELLIVSDHEIALAGGLRSDCGFLLVAGTGSIAYALAADGRSFRAGGLGHWLGDEGSAFDISFRSLVRSLRSAEGRDLPTAMLPSLLEFFGLESSDEAVPFVYSRFDKTGIARAAPLVAGFRDRGDPLAVEIYENAARELLLLCRSVRDRSGSAVDDRRLLLWGGLLENDAPYRSRISDLIRRELGDLFPVAAKGSSAEGACILAASGRGLR